MKKKSLGLLGCLLATGSFAQDYIYIVDKNVTKNENGQLVLKLERLEDSTENTTGKKTAKEKTKIFNNVAPVFALRLGIDQTEIGESQSARLFASDTSASEFKSTESSDSQFMWGGFVGLEIPLDKTATNRWQTGFAYYKTNPLDTEGIIEYLGDPSDVDVGYKYSVTNQRFMFENKWLNAINKRVLFYLMGGIGIASNETEDGKTTSLDPDFLEPLFGFNGEKVNSFSYSVGLGLEMEVVNNVRLGLGYQFSDLGKSELGGLQTPYNSGDKLENSNLYTNEFLLGINFVFN